MKRKLMSILMSMIICLSAIAFSACCEKPDVPDPGSEVVSVVSFKEIATMPTKTEYKEKEIFNISGLVASVNLSNGKTRKYYATEFKTWTHKDEPLTTAVDKITVTVPETEITFDVPVTVSEVPLAVLSVKEIKTKPKTDYVQFDVFDISDLVVTVTMTDDTEKDITGAEFTSWTHKNEPLGEGVTYIRALVPEAQDPTLYVEIPITVATRHIHVTEATLKKSPTVTNYFTHETFDISGIEVEVTLDYPVGAKRTYTADDFPAWTYNTKELEKSDAGAFTITVPHPNTTGEEKTVTVDITVSDYADLTVTKFERIVTEPSVTSYRAGETFVPTGLAVEVKLSNNRLYTIDYADEPTAFVIPTKTLAVSDEYVEIALVKSNNVKFNVSITVSESLQVDIGRFHDYYLNDDVINFTRLLVVRWIENGTANVVDPDDYELFDGNTKITDKANVTLSTVGTHTLTVKYNNVESSFGIVIKDKSSVIYPAVIEAEDNVFYKADWSGTAGGTTYSYTKDQKYNTKEYVAIAQYFDTATDSVVSGARLPTGASGTGAVSSLNNAVATGLPKRCTLLYFKFNVNVPAAGTYKLRMRAQATNQTNVNSNTFNININGNDAEELSYEPLSITGSHAIQAGNQIDQYMDLGTKADGSAVGFTSYMGLFWWSVIDLGDYELVQGENTIRLTMPNAANFNIDYFEVVENIVAADTQLVSLRDAKGGVRTQIDLSKNMIYLSEGERITDAVKASAINNTNALYDNIPYKFTLLYLIIDGVFIPVGEHMLSGLDYDLIGVEQTVTVNVTKKDGTEVATSTFNVFIEKAEEEEA